MLSANTAKVLKSGQEGRRGEKKLILTELLQNTIGLDTDID